MSTEMKISFDEFKNDSSNKWIFETLNKSGINEKLVAIIYFSGYIGHQKESLKELNK